MFSCENRKSFKNIYIEEYLRTTTSALPRIYKT